MIGIYIFTITLVLIGFVCGYVAGRLRRDPWWAQEFRGFFW
jgi:hypothetical protein